MFISFWWCRIAPRFFYFRDPHSRLTFATPIRDPISRPHSRPPFATHLRLTFATPFSRLTFTTHFRDSHSRPHFATTIRDPHSRLTFATPFLRLLSLDSRLRLHSGLPFTTCIRDHTRDSHSRLLIAPPTATRYFLLRLPSCDSTTDGRTVLTPQRHLPSVPTLTLLYKKIKILEPTPWPGLHH